MKRKLSLVFSSIYCTLHQQAREDYGLDSFDGNTPEEILRCTLFPSGTRRQLSKRQDALLGYLHFTELIDRT